MSLPLSTAEYRSSCCRILTGRPSAFAVPTVPTVALSRVQSTHSAAFRDERETDRLIREEQDHAYQRSLIDDQLREAAAAQEQRRAADVIRSCAIPLGAARSH